MQDKRRWLPSWQSIDDHRRLTYTELHADEKAATVVAFTERAIALFASHGITIERWQTDDAWTYTHGSAFQALPAAHAIRHRTIAPRTPRRNRRVERYQQTFKRESGLGQRYRSSDARAAALRAGSTTTTTSGTTARSATGRP